MDGQELIDGLNELANAKFAECPVCGGIVPVVDGRLVGHSRYRRPRRCPGSETKPDDKND